MNQFIKQRSLLVCEVEKGVKYQVIIKGLKDGNKTLMKQNKVSAKQNEVLVKQKEELVERVRELEEKLESGVKKREQEEANVNNPKVKARIEWKPKKVLV